MADIKIKLFAEADHLELQHRVSEFLRHHDVDYVDHCYIADGMDKPYNLSLVYRQKKPVHRTWRDRIFGGE